MARVEQGRAESRAAWERATSIDDRRPEYEAGRARWAAYQADVVQAGLERGLGLRPRVEGVDSGLLHRVERAFVFVEKMHPDHWLEGSQETLNPHRYCWPPVNT